MDAKDSSDKKEDIQYQIEEGKHLTTEESKCL
jgi:hypothetical protein